MDEEFYDILEQTKYRITVSKPKNMEDLSDLFVTKDELLTLIGRHQYLGGTEKRSIIMNGVVCTELKIWTDKLIASGKKTLRIDDEDLLDVVKKGYLTDFMEDDDRFGRHGNRICFARQFKRKKTKVTQGDVTKVWGYFTCAFYDKFKTRPSHIPRYDRHVRMFNAFKKIVGWRLMRKQMSDKTMVKFYRQIWDNPEEHVK